MCQIFISGFQGGLVSAITLTWYQRQKSSSPAMYATVRNFYLTVLA
jgi:hypothetical protein